MRLFIDSSAFIARYIKSDPDHKNILAVFKELSKKELPYMELFTSNAVIDETVTFILYETRNHSLAEEVLRFLTSSRFLQILYIDESIHDDACNIFGGYRDQMFSMVDCTSFALMKKHKIKTALTLDKHFATAGFKVISGRT